MTLIEQQKKIFNLLDCSFGGMFTKDRPDISSIVDHSFRSEKEYSNPTLDGLECSFFSIVDQTNIQGIPYSGFSKGSHLQVMVAFSDQHKAPYQEKSFPRQLAKQYVEDVLRISKEKNRQITIPEQFQIALNISQKDIILAALIAHTGSRAIAKHSDTRILKFSQQEIREWKDSVSTFKGIINEYGSPPADTYHFWGTFTAGLVSLDSKDIKDLLLNPIYNFLYINMAEITDIFRYKFARQGDGSTHKEIDMLGFHLGSLVTQYIKSK